MAASMLKGVRTTSRIYFLSLPPVSHQGTLSPVFKQQPGLSHVQKSILLSHRRLNSSGSISTRKQSKRKLLVIGVGSFIVGYVLNNQYAPKSEEVKCAKEWQFWNNDAEINFRYRESDDEKC